MNYAQFQKRRIVLFLSCLLWLCGLGLAVAVVAGCGSSQAPVGNTSVTLLASSTANGQLTIAQVDLISLTLISQSGKRVNLLPAQQVVEFIHLNGTAEPLATVSVPQDIYTAASATIGTADFACVNNISNGVGLDYAIIEGFGSPLTLTPVVNVPTPISITGTAMGLSLELLVSKTATFNTCPSLGAGQYSFTPTFDLSPIILASQPSNVGNGRLFGLTGLIATIDPIGKSFTVTGADGSVWSLTANSTTAFQGVSGTSSLAAGMPVNLDAVIQSGGTLLATRVEVDDTDMIDLTVTSGPLTLTTDSQQTLAFIGQLDQGYLYTDFVLGEQFFTNYNSSAVFQISGQLGNLQSLPFSASFMRSTVVPGQNVSLTSHSPNTGYVPLATVTLIPQTLNGTVTAVSSQGSFTTYAVALASYDLFPNLAVQPGQAALLTNPGIVVVYVGSDTQMLNSGVIAVGRVLRFNGLVFNDNGTLRMDCAQVNDGVAE